MNRQPVFARRVCVLSGVIGMFCAGGAVAVVNLDGTLHLGAKRAQGYGLCRAEVDWSPLPDLDASWVARLGEHREELMRLLADAAGSK